MSWCLAGLYHVIPSSPSLALFPDVCPESHFSLTFPLYVLYIYIYMWNTEAGMFSAKMPGAALMVALVVGGEYFLVETL